jgi:hypothetical protein
LNSLWPLLLAALAASLFVAACGSGHKAAAPKPKPNPRLQRDLARIQADLARLRKVTAPVTRSSLMGTPAIQKATGRFLDDLDTSVIPLITRNRLIDHAVAAVSGVCGQCFQMLEADRPIPELAHPSS